MSKYAYPDGVDVISGFGGGYEAACQKMVVAGMEWLDENPDALPKVDAFEHVYGIVDLKNQDAEALSAAIVAAVEDCTGAMHQAALSHVFYAHHNGWDKYLEEVMERP